MSPSSPALLLVLLALGGPASARVCLPPIFEDGLRLQRVGRVRTFWIDPLLRQHELCWREPASPDERRVVAVGNSTVLGFPNRADETVWAHLNRRFRTADPPAHFYNLGFAFTYQIKEVLILREAVDYAPDLVVYGLTFDDLRPMLPAMYPPTIEFMIANKGEIAALAAEHPPGVSEPLDYYRRTQEKGTFPLPFLHLREIGSLVRSAAREHAQALAALPLFGADERDPPVRVGRRQASYDCEEVRASYEKWYGGWQEWNVLAYLEWIQGRFGTRVLVVNWPVAHEPRGDCYNARYTTEGLEEYRRWLRRETDARGLAYLDLHGLLPARAFVDSLHPSARGHARVADALEPTLRALLGEGPAPGGTGETAGGKRAFQGPPGPGQ